MTLASRRRAHVSVQVLAAAVSARAWPRPALDRTYMVALREGVSRTALADLSRRHANDSTLVWGTEFSGGVLVGVLAEMSPGRAVALRRDPVVGSVRKLATPRDPVPPAEMDGKFTHAPYGWAIPGRYVVWLVTDGWSVTFRTWPSPLPYPPTTFAPVEWDWREKDAAREAAVRAVAEELIAEYGGSLTSFLAPTSPAFGVTVTERQARAMAADPRVVRVAESSVTFFFD